jgi:hypothetical protein
MGKRSSEFVRHAHGIDGRENGDRRSREKTHRSLRPLGQEKRYATLLAKANSTKELGVLLDFGATAAHRSGMGVRAPTGRLRQGYGRRDQRLGAAWHDREPPDDFPQSKTSRNGF